MNQSSLVQALAHVATVTQALAQFCEVEVIEFSAVWLGISANATALQYDLNSQDLASLIRSGARMFSYHPDSFMEAYVKRANIEEMMLANVEFDKLKERVAGAFGELRKVAESLAVT